MVPDPAFYLRIPRFVSVPHRATARRPGRSSLTAETSFEDVTFGGIKPRARFEIAHEGLCDSAWCCAEVDCRGKDAILLAFFDGDSSANSEWKTLSKSNLPAGPLGIVTAAKHEFHGSTSFSSSCLAAVH